MRSGRGLDKTAKANLEAGDKMCCALVLSKGGRGKSEPNQVHVQARVVVRRQSG